VRLKVEATYGDEPKALRDLADAVWAAQKDNTTMPFNVREAMKMLSTSIHAEAARLEKSQ
jgi:hypothetical protein